MESPIKVFSNWVLSGKDEGMEKNHSASVENMIEYSTKGIDNYSFIDAGCGNGWVVRGISSDPRCKQAIGVDGSIQMIEKAKRLDKKNNYFCSDLLDWNPKEKVDIVHSMEVFYYFKNPQRIINRLIESLNESGVLIIGIDHYSENIPSLNWDKEYNISTNTMSIKDWKALFVNAELDNIIKFVA